jgi:CubicO group peptidase (beta-lactamase class C family)
MIIKLQVSFCLLLLSLSYQSAVAQKAIPPDLDRYVEKVLTDFQVPGMAIGIVRDGKVLLTKGYGVKKLGEAGRVDEHTLFSIASNSKAFTATAMAMLVDQGKLNWEDKVRKHLPWFQMADDYVTSHLSIRDLFVHHSGLPAYANDLLLFPPSTYTRKELLGKLKDVKLTHDFRTVYAYDNILYLAAGEIIESVSGMSWEDFVKTNIFDQVGMKESISRFSTLRQQNNIAYAHVIRDGKLQVIDTFFDQNIGDAGDPAGGIAASAGDMSRWLITQLDSGQTPEKKRLFKAAGTKELWKIIRPMPIGTEPEWLKPAQRHFSGYALGFRVSDYRQQQVIGHGGLLTGFVSQIAMVPDLKLGIVVLTNQLSTGAYNAVINHIIDYNLKVKPFDWIAGYKKEWDKSRAKKDSADRKHAELLPNANLPLSLALDKYAGNYQDALIGAVKISSGPAGLQINFGRSPLFNGNLVHFQGDLFRLNYTDQGMGPGPFLSFSINPDQTVREARFISSFSDADGDFENLVLKPEK